MKKHIVKVGETLKFIAEMYEIPIHILLEFNDTITSDEEVYEGEELNIPGVDVVVSRNLEDLTKEISLAKEVHKRKMPSNQIIPDETITVTWNGRTYNSLQIGVVTITKDTHLYKRVGKGEYKKRKSVHAGMTYKGYGEISDKGGMFDVGAENYLLKSHSYFTPLPPEKLKELEDKHAAGSVIDTTVSTVVDANKNDDDIPDYSVTKPHDLPQLMMPGYRRTRLQVKKDDGSLVNIELRVLSFTRSRNNQYTQTQTNVGWGIHVGGPGLSVINVNCVFLDTKTNKESSDYNALYKKEIEPRSANDYFKSPLVSLLHKNVEYKGFVTNDSLSDESSNPLSQGFTFSFLVLSENPLDSNSKEAKAFTIPRDDEDEITFLSDLGNLLKNPITGR